MSKAHRYFASAALALALVAASATGQRRFDPSRPLVYSPPVNPNPFIAPGVSLQQAAYNTAVMGRAYQQTLPYANAFNGGGFGGYPQVAYPSVPAVPFGGANPYALSTAGGYNPYLGTAGMSASSPYSLSTAGGSYGGGYIPPYSNPISGYGGGGGYPGYGDPYGGALQGTAALTAAAGQYHVATQQARLTREQARQAALETTRKRIELERWYESTRPTSQQLRDREVAAELDRARKESPDVEVSSGRALNVLLASIQKAGSLNRGPNVELEDDSLKHVNLAGDGSLGNVGMLKDVKGLTWPEALQDAATEKARDRLVANLVAAVSIIKERDPVPESKLKDIRADYKSLNDRLDDSADELSPAKYIEARRFLNGLKDAVRALGDKNVGKYFNNTWTAKGKNVAELVSHMSKEGLGFAAAAPGDAASYKALYLALRQFEAGLMTAMK